MLPVQQLCTQVSQLSITPDEAMLQRTDCQGAEDGNGAYLEVRTSVAPDAEGPVHCFWEQFLNSKQWERDCKRHACYILSQVTPAHKPITDDLQFDTGDDPLASASKPN